MQHTRQTRHTTHDTAPHVPDLSEDIVAEAPFSEGYHARALPMGHLALADEGEISQHKACADTHLSSQPSCRWVVSVNGAVPRQGRQGSTALARAWR
jgi:hypothetical protein